MEPLEPRQLMAASALVQFGGTTAGGGAGGGGGVPADPVVTSYSNATVAGQLQTLQAEATWQDRIVAAHGEPTRYVPLAIPNDPYLAQQWHLINTGQNVGQPDWQPIFAIPGEDINVAPAWNLGYTGQGVVVGVVDSGVQTNHPDLVANLNLALQFDALSRDGNANPRIVVPNPGWQDLNFDPPGGPPSGTPQWIYGTQGHGTAVAGLIGASANGVGGVGVAPGVQLVPIRLIDVDPQALRPITLATADTFRYTIGRMDVTNNSWGPVAPPGSRAVGPMTTRELFALRDSILFGRDGLGVVHVFAAGNNAENFGTSSYSQFQSSRYQISVTGVDHDGFYNNVDGTVTGYPETGPSVFVAAPTGSVAYAIKDDFEIGSGLLTTDLTGAPSSGLGGFNIPPDAATGEEYDRDFFADDSYTSRFNGTSASAPLVAGVVALMLEADPNLSYRDVQEILLKSARQNAPLGVPQTGFGQGANLGTQNTWYVNQMPAFHDPDLWDPGINPVLQTQHPTLQYNRLTSHYQPTPFSLTTAAGHTVSQGRGANGELIGYAHGVVDATLAVQMAEQWHEKKQNLPRELTFTTSVAGVGGTIPAAEISSASGDDILIPGGLGGEAGFAAYWDWYYEFDPEEEQPENTRGVPVEFFVPDSNSMVVEWAEIKVAISGGTTAALDNLRILLVSPEGTHSELNNFYVGADGILQNLTAYTSDDTPTTAAPGERLVWCFSTNRNWGERSARAYVIDPTTGEVQFNALGLPIQKGWTLHFENYGGTELTLDTIEFVWHGSPVAANTQRVQGFVGVDENQDDLFNFSRVLTTRRNLPGDDPNTLRYGEVVNVADPNQEKFGSNVTVVVRRASDNAIVDQFVTGADGNYYFDLVPDNYILSVEDPLGRVAVDDSLTASGFLQKYRSEWRITKDWFRLWDYDASLRVPIDPATNAPFALIPPSFADPSQRVPVEAGVKSLNFLLDPGAAAANEVNFSGVVFADANKDGMFNGDDFYVPNVSVFGDFNQNGRFDAGEPLAVTGGDGAYQLTGPLEFSTVMNVGVLPPSGWTPTQPAGGLKQYFVQPGSTFAGVDFGLLAPATSNPGDPSSTLPGLITGLVFDDVNKDAVRQSSEAGLGGIRVYIDTNNSGAFDGGDIDTLTTSNGTYVFANVIPGTYFIRVQTPAPLVQTRPVLGLPFQVTLLGGGTLTGLNFGINNPALFDYGDLPAPYPTLLAQNGARHAKSAYYLGRLVDAETDARPTDNPAFPQGDNTVGFDEDGITVAPLVAGSTGRLVAEASRHGGYLQGWMDFNADGDFDDVGERIIVNKLLQPGLNEVTFQVAGSIVGAVVYARFRYGEFGINSVVGAAQIGEVEDYALAYVPPAPPVLAGIAGDFNGNARVDGLDFLAWQRGFGTTSAPRTAGDANLDRRIDGNDRLAWEDDFGSGEMAAAQAAGPLTGDFNLNGATDGLDFLAWQRHAGTTQATLAQGDGDADGQVGEVDLLVWSTLFGQSGALQQGGSPVAGSSLFGRAPAVAAALAPTASAALQDDAAGLAGAAQRGLPPATSRRAPWQPAPSVAAIDQALARLGGSATRAVAPSAGRSAPQLRVRWTSDQRPAADGREQAFDTFAEFSLAARDKQAADGGP